MRLWQFASIPACALVLLEACDKTRHDPSNANDASTTAADFDASAEGVNAKAAPERKLVLKLAAASFVASVSDQPGWPESDAGARRMGYLRNGAVVGAYDPPIKNEDCKEGWYELVEGGYVCGKVATIDLTNPRVKLAPKQPDRDAGMPYRYGVNVVDGTPLYRRVLNADDRRKFEPHLSAKTEDETPRSSGEAEKDEEPPLANVEDEAPPPRRQSRDKHDRDRDRAKDPFRPDAGRPQLKELRGRGVLVRKMARGFTVALDRDFKAANTRWWRTTFGFAVPFDRIVLQGGATKHVGNWFTGEAAIAELLPFPSIVDPDGGAEGDASIDTGAPLAGIVAFTTSSGARKLEVTEDGKGGLKVGWGTELPRRSAVLLTGREATISGVKYQQTVAGFWVHLPELKIAKPQIPSDVGADEKWIDVDLTRQQLVAFEGRRPVFATLISSGRRNPQDPERDFPTPPGSFRIREKHVTTTMDGDVASDGPYSIEDVPWVMYFQGSYALHGAFWHDSFGNMRSHGCVNMSPEDARTLFGWADPQLPAGWHGVFAKEETSGSRVIVHEDPPPGKRRNVPVATTAAGQ
ncbi:MAG TPA: L,D-transpeptidase [Labilithrix sp.]|nr:L,D-transpeptidase [Labilithrix sp.]